MKAVAVIGETVSPLFAGPFFIGSRSQHRERERTAAVRENLGHRGKQDQSRERKDDGIIYRCAFRPPENVHFSCFVTDTKNLIDVFQRRSCSVKLFFSTSVPGPSNAAGLVAVQFTTDQHGTPPAVRTSI
jgi:hypothetical protein